MFDDDDSAAAAALLVPVVDLKEGHRRFVQRRCREENLERGTGRQSDSRVIRWLDVCMKYEVRCVMCGCSMIQVDWDEKKK